jgi:hypothetical protein
MVEECLTRIEMIEKCIDDINKISSFLYQKKHRGWNIDQGNIMSTLIEEELSEWRHLFMWGLTLENEERDRIKAAAYNRFLNNDMNVSSWMNNGINPGSWIRSDEEEFREMIKKVFKPKEEENEKTI